jgi:hypothetical protein
VGKATTEAKPQGLVSIRLLIGVGSTLRSNTHRAVKVLGMRECAARCVKYICRFVWLSKTRPFVPGKLLVSPSNLRSTDWHCCASKLQKWSDFTFHDFSENVILLGMCVPFISNNPDTILVVCSPPPWVKGKESEREHTTVLISGNVPLISRKSHKVHV